MVSIDCDSILVEILLFQEQNIFDLTIIMTFLHKLT